MSELCDTAGLSVAGFCTQGRTYPHPKSYLGEGKLKELERLCAATGANTIVVDGDLTPRQQRSLENLMVSQLQETTGCESIKVLDRTAVILDIFAQRAQSREGQLQVELAMLQYRSTRGPNVAANINGNSDNSNRGTGGAGLRGPGETKLELDRRKITTRVELLQKEIEQLQNQRLTQRKGRSRMGAPLVALVGYTNAGKSTVLNRLSKAGVLAENKLFATLDPTTRKVRLPSGAVNLASQQVFTSASSYAANSAAYDELNYHLEVTQTTSDSSSLPSSEGVQGKQGMEILLTDTVGFISKFPSHIVAAFRATLESLADADVLLHVIDRANPAWETQRAVVNGELARIAHTSGKSVPVVEFWNKMDALGADAVGDIVASVQAMPIEMEMTPPSDDTEIAPVEAQTRTRTLVGNAPPIGDELGEISDKEGVDEELESISCLPDAARDAPITAAALAPKSKSSRKSKTELSQTMLSLESSFTDDDNSSGSDGMDSYRDAKDTAEHATVLAKDNGANAEVDAKAGKLAAAPSKRRLFTAVGSAVAPGGMSDLFAKLEQALTVDYPTVECVVPYAADAGVTSGILLRGLVLGEVQYEESGARIRCKVPPHLAESLAASGFVQQQQPPSVESF